ncbi:hypothetical protein RHMOL_Rhmol07G0183800 [Rhododendron molle]|uniref:Uncharacterized protein n=1 Tax=Rhododendron molle TaxID=49168 RepID=A0ACC0N364_RHOML|nr:hypothetical protein RHMOL_Rhmol07G0183800 [Rhododendron molle]
MMATATREARRRRIVDRGSDRLALITGGINILPSSSLPSTINHNHDQPIGSDAVDDKSSNSLLPMHESASESGEINAAVGKIRDQLVLCKCETTNEDLRALSWEVDSQSQSSQVLSPVQESPICSPDTECQLEPQGYRARFFTPKQISSAIKATESIRIYTSLAAAIIVVLSFVGFPVLGSCSMKSILFFRPLHLVLITNVSIVLSRLLLDKKQAALERTDQQANKVSPAGRYGLAERVGKALELGLVLQRIMGALFMDCSVYAIVLICGLSVAQKLGW